MDDDNVNDQLNSLKGNLLNIRKNNLKIKDILDNRRSLEENFKTYLNFLMDNVFVVFGGTVFRRTVGIPVGTDCAPLLADLFVYSYEAEYIQKLMSSKQGKLAASFSFTFSGWLFTNESHSTHVKLKGIIKNAEDIYSRHDQNVSDLESLKQSVTKICQQVDNTIGTTQTAKQSSNSSSETSNVTVSINRRKLEEYPHTGRVGETTSRKNTRNTTSNVPKETDIRSRETLRQPEVKRPYSTRKNAENNTKAKESTADDRLEKSKPNSVHYVSVARKPQKRPPRKTFTLVPLNPYGFKASTAEWESDNRVVFTNDGGRRLASDRDVRLCEDGNRANVTMEDVRRKKDEDNKKRMAELEELMEENEDFLNLLPGLARMMNPDPEADIGFQKWFSYAEKEKNSGIKPSRGKGPDTVLCLDTSKSMAGQPFKQMVSMALDIVNGIEQVQQILGIPENIAVTTFGGTTRVLRHMSNDYGGIKDVIRSLPHPNGSSPFAGGLLVALAGCFGNGTDVTMRGLLVPCRIILLSDGHATPDHIESEDEPPVTDTKSKRWVNMNISEVAHNLKQRGIRVYSIPVGDANLRNLGKISKITRGKVFRDTDLPSVIKMAQHTVEATHIVKGCSSRPGFDTENARATFEEYFKKIKVSSNSDENDVLDLAEFLQSIKTDITNRDGKELREIHEELPLLGTRVLRGPGWKYPDSQDSKGPGTIYTHGQNKEIVWVEWDNGRRNSYNFVKKEVITVDEPRILKDDLIAVGCRVKRGPNWRPKLNDQDGGSGNIGVVLRVQEAGIVDVVWPNRRIGDYRFGFDGNFELQLCEESEEPRSSFSTNQNEALREQDGDQRVESFLEKMNRRNKDQ